MSRSTLWLCCWVAIGCGESHMADRDADVGPIDARIDAAACEGPAPTGCYYYEFDNFCCDEIPARCEDGEWICEDIPDRWSCESSCRTGGFCRGVPPSCRVDLGGGCCGDSVTALCEDRINWTCSPGSVGSSECRSLEPDCSPVVCEGLGEVECASASECVPTYDDACCSSCTPGPCADCVHIEYFGCETREAACSGETCSRPADGACDDELPDCSLAFPSFEGPHCSIPGCIKAREPDCVDESCTSCVPLRGDSCQAVCFATPPECGEWYPEAASGCFTGLCISPELCVPG